MPKPKVKSKGALEFSRLDESTAELVDRLGVSANYISQLRSGNRTPGPQLAAKIEGEWPHLTAALWGEDAGPSKAVVNSAAEMLDAVEVPEVEDDNPVAFARRILQYGHIAEHAVRDALRKGDPGADKALTTLADLPIKLGKLLGHSLTEREVLDSPPFRDLVRRLMGAIEGFSNSGEIAKAMIEALEVSDG